MPAPARQVLEVAAAHAGERLDRFLAAQLPGLSRARCQALIEGGHVRLDGAATRAAARLRAGQRVSFEPPPPEPAQPQPEDLPLNVVYEDSHLLVLDKPAGLSVHPGAGRTRGTLVNALLHHVRDLSGIGGVLRPGIVHRLDRGTSGLLVVAKHDRAHQALARQFAARLVEKEYLALVLGVPRAATGRSELPIGRDPHRRTRMAVRPGVGRPAHSEWRLVEAFAGAALLRVRIHTGRTHQIRVHLSAAGHPVAGDAAYGGRQAPPGLQGAARAALLALGRPALHAARLAFAHPEDGRRLEFTSPLPAELQALLALLRAEHRGA